MSGAAAANNPSTAKLGQTNESNDQSQPLAPQKGAAQLEEDDEFEDFPVEGERRPRSVRYGGRAEERC